MTRGPKGPATLLVGATIREVRRHRGWSQRQLAERLGWNPSMVTRAELGLVHITVEQLAALGQALLVSPGRLLRGVHPKVGWHYGGRPPVEEGQQGGAAADA